MNKTIGSGARSVIHKVFLRCLAENEAGQLLSALDDVYQRTADMTGIYTRYPSFRDIILRFLYLYVSYVTLQS